MDANDNCSKLEQELRKQSNTLDKIKQTVEEVVAAKNMESQKTEKLKEMCQGVETLLNFFENRVNESFAMREQDHIEKMLVLDEKILMQTQKIEQLKLINMDIGIQADGCV